MNRLTSAIARIGLGLLIVCATLVSTASSSSATQEKHVQLASGHVHTCALLVSGSVQCWGENEWGQLGLGYTSQSSPYGVSSPTLVPGLTDVASIVAGDHHTCVLLVSGSVKCWGLNNVGQLGLGYASDSVSSPTLVQGLTGVASIVLGGYHTCAVLILGSVKCWGDNEQGQLGLGYTNGSVSSPTLVPGLTDVASVALSTNHSCALLVSGSVKCWGYNEHGELGLGYTGEPVLTPTAVPDLTDVTSLVAGEGHTCALLVSGSVECWGYNSYGQLGLGGTSESVASPTSVPGLTDVRSLSAGGIHTCAALVSGPLKCWGWNFHGQLGLGYTSIDYHEDEWCGWDYDSWEWVCTPYVDQYSWVASPTEVPGLTDVDSLELGGNHSCAVVSGSVECWGYNHYGQLGQGGTSESVASPTVVPGVSTWPGLAAPTSLAVSSVDGTSVGVTFVSPADVTANDPITGFDYSLDGGATWITPVTPVLSSPLIIGGLSYVTTYSVKVRAVSAHGLGHASEAISVTTLAIPASAPRIKYVVTASGRASLAIAAPSVVGDTALTGYDYSIDNGSTWSHFASVDGPFKITGLTNGTTYQVKVRAVNSAGPGAESAVETVVPEVWRLRVPAAPNIVSIVPSAGALTFRGTAPNNGGSKITDYQYTLDGGITWYTANPPVTSSPYKLTGLANGTTYRVQVRAVNAVGVGAATAVVVVSMPLG